MLTSQLEAICLVDFRSLIITAVIISKGLILKLDKGLAAAKLRKVLIAEA